MLHNFSLCLCFLALIILLFGCSNDQNPIVNEQTTASEQTDWLVNIINGQPIITTESGNVGIEEYQNAVKNFNGNQSKIAFREFPVIPEEVKLAGDWNAKIGTTYFVRISAETHYLGGCINKIVPHVGILIKYQDQRDPFVDIHLAIWKQNGKVCAAIYNSGANGGFCWSICSPTYKDIQNGLNSALLAAGIGASMAAIMAVIITPVVLMLSPVGL